jgi:hypothetical protein
MQRQNPPPWDDERAVARLADIVMPQVEAATEMKAAAQAEIVLGLDWSLSPLRAKASAGDLAAVAELVHAAAERGYISSRVETVMLANLSKATRDLVVDIVWASSEGKPGRGRPRMSAAGRRKINPLHDAADNGRAIVPILRQIYPDKRRDDILNRSAAVAAEIARRSGWKTVTKRRVLRHMTRPLWDRRRVHP